MRAPTRFLFLLLFLNSEFLNTLPNLERQGFQVLHNSSAPSPNLHDLHTEHELAGATQLKRRFAGFKNAIIPRPCEESGIRVRECSEISKVSVHRHFDLSPFGLQVLK